MYIAVQLIVVYTAVPGLKVRLPQVVNKLVREAENAVRRVLRSYTTDVDPRLRACPAAGSMLACRRLRPAAWSLRRQQHQLVRVAGYNSSAEYMASLESNGTAALPKGFRVGTATFAFTPVEAPLPSKMTVRPGCCPALSLPAHHHLASPGDPPCLLR